MRNAQDNYEEIRSALLDQPPKKKHTREQARRESEKNPLTMSDSAEFNRLKTQKDNLELEAKERYLRASRGDLTPREKRILNKIRRDRGDPPRGPFIKPQGREELTAEELEILKAANPMYELHENGEITYANTGEPVKTAEARIADLEHQLEKLRVDPVDNVLSIAPDLEPSDEPRITAVQVVRQGILERRERALANGEIKHLDPETNLAELERLQAFKAKILERQLQDLQETSRALVEAGHLPRGKGRPQVGQGSQRVGVTIEGSLLAEIDKWAEIRGWSRSSFLARAARLLIVQEAKIGRQADDPR